MINESMDPVVECGNGYIPVLAEVRDRAGAVQICTKNSQNESWRKGTVENQAVWEEPVSVTAGFALISGDGDFTVNPLTIGYRDHGSGVG